jgi:hypothetical protein
MRRGIRIMSGILAAVTLLVAVVGAHFWVASYWGPVAWFRARYSVEKNEYRHYWVQSADGRVMASFWRVRIDEPYVEQMREVAAAGSFRDQWVSDARWMWRPRSSRRWEEFGAYVYVEKDVRSGIAAGQGSLVMVLMPYWVLVGLLLIGPAVCVVRWASRRRRFGEGRCQRCGYDLRASPEQCPECGAMAARPAEV